MGKVPNFCIRVSTHKKSDYVLVNNFAALWTLAVHYCVSEGIGSFSKSPFPRRPCATHNLVLSFQMCLCFPADLSPSVVLTCFRPFSWPKWNNVCILYKIHVFGCETKEVEREHNGITFSKFAVNFFKSVILICYHCFYAFEGFNSYSCIWFCAGLWRWCMNISLTLPISIFNV
jgi:hypothetical protein